MLIGVDVEVDARPWSRIRAGMLEKKHGYAIIDTGNRELKQVSQTTNPPQDLGEFLRGVLAHLGGVLTSWADYSTQEAVQPLANVVGYYARYDSLNEIAR